VEVVSRAAKLTQWAAGGASGALTDLPLEPLALAEPHGDDHATRSELGLVFFRMLDDAYAGTGTSPAAAKTVFLTKVPLPTIAADKLNPIEESTRQLLSIVSGKVTDGVAVLGHAKAGTFPDGLAAGDQGNVTKAYGFFKDWVAEVFGQIGTGDPAGWDPQRLDQTVTVKAGPAATPANVITAQPDSDGTLQWSSFDLQSEASDPLTGASPATLRMQPAHVRFPGMPSPRYWDFEEGELAFADVDLEKRDLLKLLFVDFALVDGVDWFVVPVEQEVGTLAKIDSVVVRDVFGGRTTISRADDPTKPPGDERWTMYSMARPGTGLANYNIIPPTMGPGLVTGPVLEEVRFARDEMANMAWAIERSVENRVGEPRPGAERDAASGAALTPPPPPATTAPLRYQVESPVPLNWIPLVAVPIANKAPAIQLQKARVLRPDPAGGATPVTVPSLGRILDREPYFLPEEELSRAGVRVDRVVFRARWKDGTSRLWVTRRRHAGAGETQSGLRFDAGLPTTG
jgi:hypothetical protein